MHWRVGIAGSQRWALQGLAQALQRAGVAAFEPVVLDDLRRLPPLDVLVLAPADAQAAKRLADHLPSGLPVLWLGEGSDLPRRGATGRIAGDAGDEILAAAVHAVASGLHVHDGAPRKPVPAPATELSEPLTPRELEVLELLAKGLANREIALALGISSHTAKFHVAQILEKAGAATRTEAVRQGLRLGLIGL